MAAHALALQPEPTQFVTALRCEFVKPGYKGEDDRVCRAEFSLLPPSAPLHGVIPTPARDAVSSPANSFVVHCDDDVVYDGGGFTSVTEFTGNPQFAAGVISAINGSILPTYPSVVVDGDFLDFTYGFKDRPARLYFSHDEYILGTCDHEAIVRSAMTRR
jgi:hypothetical protein